jgi:CBS domain containing-hemolysin-like protein
MQEIVELALILLLLVFSFIFSGSEVSLLSISEHDKHRLARERDRKNTLILFFLRYSQKALITILVGNMIVNTSASILGEQLSRSFFHHHQLLFSVVIMTSLLLLFGEVVPKNVAASRPVRFSRRTVGVLNVTYQAFYPLIQSIARLVGAGETRRDRLTKRELSSAVETGSDAGLDQVSINLLKNLIHLIDLPITDLMIPRSEISALGVEDPWSRMERYVRETPYSTVLFYRENVDNIVGYVKKSRLLHARKKDLPGLLVKPVYIPESKHIFPLLREFKRSGKHLAVVLDEFGGTTGMVTVKDILDSIFIKDVLLKRYVQRTSKNSWVVRGSTPVPDLNELLHTDIPVEHNTIGGYVGNLAGDIPEVGEELVIDERYTVKIVKRSERQIELMEVRRRAG